MAHLLAEADEIQSQCKTQRAQYVGLDEASLKSDVRVRTGPALKPCTVANIVGDTEEKIVDIRARVTQRTTEIHQLDEKWSTFEEERNKLMTWIRDAKNAVERISATENNLTGLEQLVQTIDGLLTEMKSQQVQKDIFLGLGKELTQMSPASLGSVQNTTALVDTEWELLQHLLLELQAQFDDITFLWDQCSEARVPIVSLIRECCEKSESIQDQRPDDMPEVVSLSDTCRKVLDTVRKSRAGLESLTSKSTQLHNKLEHVKNFNTHALRQEMAQLQKDWNEVQASLNASLQNLDMQLIMWRQVTTLKDEILNWASDSRETLDGALSQSIDIELMEMKLSKVKQELPTYVSIQDNIRMKVNQLAQLNKGQRPNSVSGLEHLVQQEMEAVKNMCTRMEVTIKEFNKQEAELHRDIKELVSTIGSLKSNLKNCEDVMANDESLAKQFAHQQQVSAEYEPLKKTVNALLDRCRKLQKQRGSASEAFPLMKELRSAQKQLENLGTLLKKIGASLLDTLNKRFGDRLSSVQRTAAVAREKLDWCSSEPSADRYSIEAKLSAIQGVESSLTDLESKLSDVKHVADAIISIADPETKARVSAQVQASNNDLQSLKEDCQDRKSSIEYANDVLRKFELTSENISSWLREAETHIRNETINATALSQLSNKVQSMSEFFHDVRARTAEVGEVQSLAQQVMDLMPESHVSHFSSHINMRHSTTLKFVTSSLEKLQTLEHGYAEYRAAVQQMERWLESSREQLRVHEKDVMSPSSKPSLAYQSKLQALKVFVEEKDQGQSLLNQAVNAGDALVPNITPEDKTEIRTILRKLRDDWEAHLDRVNSLYKKVEGIILQLSSFDDSCRQIRSWIDETRARLNSCDTGPENQDKKAELQAWRLTTQDILSHRSLISRLRERLQEISDPEASSKVDAISTLYEQLVHDSQQRVISVEMQVAHLDSYSQSLEKFRDWFASLKADLVVTEEGVTDKAAAQPKIRLVAELLQQKGEGDQMLQQAQSSLEQLANSMTGDAHYVQTVRDDFDKQCNDWKAFLAECQERHCRLIALCSRWTNFEDMAQVLATWLRQVESQVQDQALKATLPAKEAHLEKLRAIQIEIGEKERQFSEIFELSQTIEGDSMLQIQVPQMVSRYQSLTSTSKEMISRYQQFVNEHQNFLVNYQSFAVKIDNLANDLNSLREIVGDYKILQDRRVKMDKLQDVRIELDKESEDLGDLGEKLYVHTAPDGREMLRVQLKTMRERWESLCEDLSMAFNKLDQCLQQFAEFSAGQEQLTRWLRDVEQSMLQHSDLKSTLQEKRAQLQSHKIVHQEILVHQSLVESVCHKAQQLIDQTQDKSLCIYTASIKQLFVDIVRKSEELMGRLETCVKDHTQLSGCIKSFQDWVTSFRDQIQGLSDTSGEKIDAHKRLHSIEEMQVKLEQGNAQVEELHQLCATIAFSTSPRGVELSRKTVTSLEEELHGVSANLDELKKNAELVVQRWQSLEDGMEVRNAWFRQQETVLANQQLQNTLEDKEDQLASLLAVRDNIINYEAEIEKFIDQATALFQSSGVERIRPLISQFSTKYQQLHVQSKEVISRWQGIVDDHQVYEEKFMETIAWIISLEDTLTTILKSCNSEEHNSAPASEAKANTKISVQALMSEKEQASHRLGSLTTAGERIFPETASNGREKIRQDLKLLRNRWEELERRLNEQQKKHEQQLQLMTSYQDGIIQIGIWLDMIEKSVSNDQTSQAVTIPEIRSHMLKQKTHLQDVLGHKRPIEALKERARSLVEGASSLPQTKESQGVLKTIGGIGQRYDALCANLQASVMNSEWLLEVLQQHHDLSKAHQDWQQQAWIRLNSNTGKMLRSLAF